MNEWVETSIIIQSSGNSNYPQGKIQVVWKRLSGSKNHPPILGPALRDHKSSSLTDHRGWKDQTVGFGIRDLWVWTYDCAACVLHKWSPLRGQVEADIPPVPQTKLCVHGAASTREKGTFFSNLSTPWEWFIKFICPEYFTEMPYRPLFNCSVWLWSNYLFSLKLSFSMLKKTLLLLLLRIILWTQNWIWKACVQ